ncbi:hypothetical protein NSQ95_05565 [Psychrobacillus sp. FSL W7-1457]|uniref:hypothetical protein n=1 Tax=unclassified Psychrobacillus TaxID=2636677 RepID=UPI0030FA2B96
MGFRLKSTKTVEDCYVTYPKYLMDKLYYYYQFKIKLQDEMDNLLEGFKDEEGKEVLLLFSNEYGKPYRPDSVTQF